MKSKSIVLSIFLTTLVFILGFQIADARKEDFETIGEWFMFLPRLVSPPPA